MYEVEGSSLSIFPNPTNGKVSIESGVELIRIKLFDATGRLIEDFDINNKSSHVLDLSNLEPAVYSVVISTVNGEHVERIVRY